jgi:CheY-like chemotaxis protein
VGKRVLLAEDNLINQTVARKMLSSIGMQVEVASNGAEAVAAVRRTRAAAAAAGAGAQGMARISEDTPQCTTSTTTTTSSSGGPDLQQQRTGEQAAAAASALVSVGSSSNNLQQPFAIILMDMAMPVMGGVEATRLLREEGFNLPIIAMTANASDRDRDECAAAGMNGFLSKPVLRDQLARAMLAAVEAAAAAAAAAAACDGEQG